MIGVFDSGLGGLTVLASLLSRLPGYDYVYLGDNARAPYGMRSPETVYEFTREAVTALFELGCPLVVLACNTASARALRTLQQRYLPVAFPDRRVLGVVRPSVEALAGLPPGALPGVTAPAMVEGTVAVVGTPGTIASDSYQLELAKRAPRLRLVQRACPMWVSLVECGELTGEGTRYFLRKELDPLFAPASGSAPSRLLLGCTHYPLLLPEIRRLVPSAVEVLAQGDIVAERLEDWLVRHPEVEARLGKQGRRRYLTTDDPVWFAAQGAAVLGGAFEAEKLRLHAVA